MNRDSNAIRSGCARTGATAAALAGKVSGEPFQKGYTIGGAGLATLLEFDDAAANIPVGSRKQPVDRARGRMASLVKQLGNASDEGAILRQWHRDEIVRLTALGHGASLLGGKRQIPCSPYAICQAKARREKASLGRLVE